MADKQKHKHPPQTPEEARKRGVDWVGIPSGQKRPNLNRHGINEQPGSKAPKPGIKRKRWGQV